MKIKIFNKNIILSAGILLFLSFTIIGCNKQLDINQQDSTISAEDLKDINGTKIPKSKRKNKSDKNIVCLDI